MADIEKLVEQLSELTVLEAAELSKALEEKWGVSAAAPVAVAAAAAAGPTAGGEPAKEDRRHQSNPPDDQPWAQRSQGPR
jgi:large subunit ribosomal protein L7/L12